MSKNRIAIRYRCRGPVGREIQFNFDGQKITCIGSNGPVGTHSIIEELRCMADNLGVASRELISHKEKQWAEEKAEVVLRARAEVFKEMSEYYSEEMNMCSETGQDPECSRQTMEQFDVRYENTLKHIEALSRADRSEG